MKVPALLRQPINPRKDIDAQCDARFKAVFALYGVPWRSPDDEQKLLIRMMRERFQRAFEFKTAVPDNRVKVKNVEALRELVDALIEGTEDQLADGVLRARAIKARRWLKYRGMKASERSIAEALHAVDDEFKGISSKTLRDALQRPPDSAAKRKHIEQKRARAEERRVRAALIRFSKSMDGVSDDEDFEIPPP